MTDPHERYFDEDFDRRNILKITGTGLAAATAGCLDSLNDGGDGDDGGDGGGDGGGSSGSGGGGDNPSFVYYERGPIAEDYAEAFMQDHPDITVETNTEGPDERYKGLVAKVQAGQGPDTLGLSIGRFAEFVEAGFVREINDVVDNLPYYDEFFQSAKDKFIYWDGDAYGVPFWIDCSLMYYNKAHFEEAGLDPESPPTTWEELRQVAAELSTDTSPAISLSAISGSTFLWLPFVWANGGRFVNDDGTKCLLDEQPAVEALELWVDLSDNGYTVDPLTGWTDFHNRFVNGDTSIMFSGGFGFRYVKENNPDMFENDLGNHVFPKPSDGSYSSETGGNALSITTQTEGHPEKFEATKKFLEWVNTENGMRETFEQGYMPARPSGFNLDIATEGAYDKLFDSFQHALEVGDMTIHPAFEEMKGYLNPALEQAITGQKTPQEALTDATESINEEVLSG